MSENESILTVRVALLPYFLVTYVLAALLFTALIFSEHRAHFHYVIYGVCLVFLALTVFVMIAIMQWLMVVRISATEIKGFNGWAIPATVRWDEISELKPFNFIGIKYLRICSKRHYWPIWFPLQISNEAATLKKLFSFNETANRLMPFFENV